MAPLARPTAECIPLIGCVAELPPFRNFRCDSPVPQIFSSRVAYFSFDQVFVEPLRSLSMQLDQTLAQFTLAFFIAGPAPAEFLDHGDASARGEFAHG